MQVQFLNPDFPSSPSFSFHPSTCDFSYSFNTHLLRTYGVPVTAETEGPPVQWGWGDRHKHKSQCSLPGSVLFGGRILQCLRLEPHRPAMWPSVSFCKMGVTLVQIIIIITTANIIIILTSSALSHFHALPWTIYSPFKYPRLFTLPCFSHMLFPPSFILFSN